MQVKFVDANQNPVTQMDVPGEDYEEVCANAWELILEGAIVAEDFAVLNS